MQAPFLYGFSSHLSTSFDSYNNLLLNHSTIITECSLSAKHYSRHKFVSQKGIYTLNYLVSLSCHFPSQSIFFTVTTVIILKRKLGHLIFLHKILQCFPFLSSRMLGSLSWNIRPSCFCYLCILSIYIIWLKFIFLHIIPLDAKTKS